MPPPHAATVSRTDQTCVYIYMKNLASKQASMLYLGTISHTHTHIYSSYYYYYYKLLELNAVVQRNETKGQTDNNLRFDWVGLDWIGEGTSVFVRCSTLN